MNRALIPLLAALFVGSLAAVQDEQPPKRHWQETGAETIWRDRYTNCDYGYYVTLPVGVVAHGNPSPSPNHGFLVPLPDVSRTSEASVSQDTRFIWVDASYNVSDYHSLAAVANYELKITRGDKQSFRVIARDPSTVAGLPAIRFRVKYEQNGRKVVEEQVIALRAGIVYTLGVRTSEVNRLFDEKQFRRILNGFKLLKLPRGECSNG